MKIDDVSVKIRVLGLVQGIGFRPFVARLALKLNLKGHVENNSGIVVIYAKGKKSDIDLFLSRLENESPSGSNITQIDVSEAPSIASDTFVISESGMSDTETPLIPADLPTCKECLNDLYDTTNRRYLNPFVSCVSCGPRYSIIKALPYDRRNTTMAYFEFCENCDKEYTEHGRREYAQTISCHDCGPYLILNHNGKALTLNSALQYAAKLLKNGKILAVKGVGGYHFMCSPFIDETVARLRILKMRDKKPFALLFPTLVSLRKYCDPSEEEIKLFTSSPRPIVLMRFSGSGISSQVCAESRYLGAFLAYTPLQQLLSDMCGPLVATSANISDEPIIKDDMNLISLDSEYLDGVLYFGRDIVVPLDDSVARVVCGTPQLIRRSRGYVPEPIPILNGTENVFAAGGDLKSAFCITSGGRAYMSQYFGDLEHPDVQKVYEENLRHMTKLFKIRPTLAASDLHPNYFSTRIAQNSGLQTIPVQHHHAHIASVIAEHLIDAAVIGVAFDGTGYGNDGAVWGGEFLLCEGASFNRVAHLSYTSICGGDNAAKDASLCAISYACAAGHTEDISDSRVQTVCSAIEKGIGTHKTSSMGRLFDAVSAILGIKTYNSYEGECAITLENYAWEARELDLSPYPLKYETEEKDGVILIDTISLVRGVFDSVLKNTDKRAVALGFHLATIDMVCEICLKLREKHSLNTVALSGGVFANLMLLEGCINRLSNDGFKVFYNQAVPTNDGGIALGQAYIARLTKKNGGKQNVCCFTG